MTRPVGAGTSEHDNHLLARLGAHHQGLSRGHQDKVYGDELPFLPASWGHANIWRQGMLVKRRHQQER